MSDTLQAKVEKSIREEFHASLFAPFCKACKTYELISPGDRIAVCISGGKDSMLMGKLFQEILKHNKVDFSLEFLVMDPGYADENMSLLMSNAHSMVLPVSVFTSPIFSTIASSKTPCYDCARQRRGYLYSQASSLGCNKIALGHHYDDVIETTLMSMLYGGQVQTMMPKLRSRNYPGMELIRPMYLIREADIVGWASYCGLSFLDCACRVTDSPSKSSTRQEIKELIAYMKAKNPSVEANIFSSVENVDLDSVIGYKSKGERHLFLDDY